MLLSLKVLNEDATLNNFKDIGSYQTIKGSDAKIILELIQPDRNLRYMPAVGAVITCDFKQSDNTVLTKTATFPFAADRSIIQFDLSDTETALLVSQNLVVKVQEGSVTTYAILQGGFSMASLTQSC